MRAGSGRALIWIQGNGVGTGLAARSGRRNVCAVGPKVGVLCMGNGRGIVVWGPTRVGEFQARGRLVGRKVPRETRWRVWSIVEGSRLVVGEEKGLGWVIGRRRLRWIPVH